ncbi:MAG: hypothetical protein Q9184_000777 [Pyrenodesmia sp. 2 TL-2023]
MPRKSNVSRLSATGDEGTPAKEKDGVNIEDLSLPRSMVQRLAKGVLPPNTQIQKDAITAMSKGATVFVNHIADKYGQSRLAHLSSPSSYFYVMSGYVSLSFPSEILRCHCLRLLHASHSFPSTYFSHKTVPHTTFQSDPLHFLYLQPPLFLFTETLSAPRANEITLSTNRKTISPTAVLEALAECEFAEFLPRVEAELKRFNEIATGKRNEYRRKVKEKEMGVNGSAGSKDGEGSQIGGNAGMGADEEEEGGHGERASKRIRREEGDEALLAGQLRQEAGEFKGVGEEGDTRDELGVEEDEVEGEQLRLREEEDAEEDDDDEISDDEAEQESEGAESGSGSGVDMDARLRAIQDGLGSGVDGSGSEEESD